MCYFTPFIVCFRSRLFPDLPCVFGRGGESGMKEYFPSWALQPEARAEAESDCNCFPGNLNL